LQMIKGMFKGNMLGMKSPALAKNQQWVKIQLERISNRSFLIKKSILNPSRGLGITERSRKLGKHESSYTIGEEEVGESRTLA